MVYLCNEKTYLEDWTSANLATWKIFKKTFKWLCSAYDKDWKIVRTFIFFCKFHKISIDNSYKIFLAKLDLAGHV